MLLDVEEIYNLTSLIDNILTKDVDELWLVAPNALRLTKILAVLMPTSASTERSFSTMGMVKTKLRNTSGDERTDYLVIIKASQDKLKQIDLIKLCNKFTEATAHTGRRKKLFGTFVRSDLIDMSNICEENLTTESFCQVDCNDNDSENSSSSSEDSDDKIPSPSGFGDVSKQAAV